jgi:hypothetical protein
MVRQSVCIRLHGHSIGWDEVYAERASFHVGTAAHKIMEENVDSFLDNLSPTLF